MPARGRCAGPRRPHRSPQGTRGPSQRGRGRRRPYFEGEVVDAAAGRARTEEQQQQRPQRGPGAAGRHLCSSVSVPRAPLPGQARHVQGGAASRARGGRGRVLSGIMEGLAMAGRWRLLRCHPRAGQGRLPLRHRAPKPDQPGPERFPGSSRTFPERPVPQARHPPRGRIFLPVFSPNFLS